MEQKVRINKIDLDKLIEESYKNKKKSYEQKKLLISEESKIEKIFDISYDDLLKIKSKEIKKLRLQKAINLFKTTINDMSLLIKEMGYLTNNTEYWEGISTIDFNYEDWNTIRNVRTMLCRNINKIFKVKEKIQKGDEKDAT